MFEDGQTAADNVTGPDLSEPSDAGGGRRGQQERGGQAERAAWEHSEAAMRHLAPQT